MVGETVQLKKAGTTFKGLCPFHGEKTASFTVTPNRDSWKCFGCGLGGDVFSFVMQRDGVSFPEALRTLAAKAGVEIDERTKREDAHRARLRDILEMAIAFHHQVLTSTSHGKPALDYLRGRGFTDKTIEDAQLGWSIDQWDSMSRTLVQKRGVQPQELIDAGLASPARSHSRGVGVIDKFRGRVLWPIRDQNGHATGMGGRILGAEGEGGRDTGPKYLNTPGTALFDKSRSLYLIDKAKSAMRKTEQAVIVEGYTDALMAHQAGFDNVVASLGTALTAGQVALLTRYAKRIALAYDVDPAGQKAGTFGAQALQSLIGQLAATESGIELDEVRVVRLPAGKDPDEVLRETPDRWREEVRTAQPIVEYLVDTYAKTYDLKTPGGKARFVDALMPTIRAVPNPVMRDEYLQQVHRASGVEERVLLEVLRGARIGGASGLASGAGPSTGARVASSAADGGSRISAEAIVAAADSLPVSEILRGVLPQEAEFLRLLLLVPELQLKIVELHRAGPAPEHRGPRALPRRRARSGAGRRRGPPAVQPDRAHDVARPRDGVARPGGDRAPGSEPARPDGGRARLRGGAPDDRSRGALARRARRLHRLGPRRGRAGPAGRRRRRNPRIDGPAASREPGAQRAAQVAPSPARPDPSPRASHAGARMTTESHIHELHIHMNHSNRTLRHWR